MPLKNLLNWKELKKNLKKFLKKYKDIEDIIIFGSVVKEKFQPQDIDIAVITKKKDFSVIGEIASQLPEEADIEVLSSNQIYKTVVGLSIISEGFSIKENKFLKDMVGLKPQKVYSYNLKELTSSEKRQFHRALKEHLDEVKGTRLGAGCVIIPIEKTGFFEDFLNRWNLKFKTKKYNVW